MDKIKHSIITAIFFLFLASVCISCGDDTTTDDDTDDTGIITRTGRVTFFNESSYRVRVHRDTFAGPVLLELASGSSQQVDVRISDNLGFGTTFSIIYLYRIDDAFDADSGDIIADGIDYNVQINRTIEENRSITVQIPQPTDLEFRSAFIRILNAHTLPFELRHLNTVFRQAGNNQLSVPPGGTGIYKLEGIPDDGRLYQNYEVVSTFAPTTIPEFTARNGYIYNFTYNGTSVTLTGSQTIVFN